MKMNDIRKIAKEKGINSFGLSKIVLVRKIQEREGNYQCFATERIRNCNEHDCLWLEDCKKLFFEKLQN